MLFPLSLLFGTLVGFALGLTGGGGSLLAVPLLVYGLAVAPREAFGVSLAAVGATALIGVVPRMRAGHVELGTGILFAMAGMVGAPLGTWFAGLIPEALLLVLFSGLMLLVAVRMWAPSRTQKSQGSADSEQRRSCRRTEDGALRLDAHCTVVIGSVGLVAGILSGMFGVGGRFRDCASAGSIQRDADSQGSRDVVTGDFTRQCFGRGIARCCRTLDIARRDQLVHLGWCCRYGHWRTGWQAIVSSRSAEGIRRRHRGCRGFRCG